MLPLLMSLACAPKVPPEAAPTAPSRPISLVTGPWDNGGTWLTVAATGPRSLEGLPSGPSILVTAWVQDGLLVSASSFNSGLAWSRPAPVAEGLVVDAAGQGRPELAFAPGGPLLAYAASGRPALARRSGAEWTLLGPSAAARGAVFDLAVVDEEPLLAWVDTREAPTLVVLWQGEEVTLGPALACQRPGAGALERRPAVAWRQPDGALQLASLEEDGWTVRALGPGPADCDAGGPALGDGRLVVSGGMLGERSLRAPLETQAPLPPFSNEAWQPRLGGGTLARLERREGRIQLFVDDVALVGSDDAAPIPGDVVRLGQGLLVPFTQHGAARLAAIGPEAEAD